MSIQTLTIESVQFPVMVYRDTRVVTTELLAKFFDTDAIRVQQNHNRNRDRFIEGKHYYKIDGVALQEFVTSLKIVANQEADVVTRLNLAANQNDNAESSLKILANVFRNPETIGKVRNLILWTERGAARHAKMLETDQAWDIFEKLEDAYFGVQPTQNTTKRIEPTTLTASEQQTLSELVHRRVADYGPNMGKALAEIWSRVHRKFRVAKYDQLPREQVSDVIAYIMAMEIKTTQPPKIEAPQPVTPAPLRNYAQVRAHMDNLRDWAQRALPESARTPFLNNLEDLDRCLIAGWTEMDEAVLHLSLAASVLRRWRNLH